MSEEITSGKQESEKGHMANTWLSWPMSRWTKNLKRESRNKLFVVLVLQKKVLSLHQLYG